MPGTLLHSAVLRALYEFQGSQGARALVLVTDGNAFDDDVEEKDAIAYARQSGRQDLRARAALRRGDPYSRAHEGPDGTDVFHEKVRRESYPANSRS